MRNIKTIIKEIEKQKEKIARARDKLRDIEDELVGCCEAFDNGLDDLSSSIQCLSEYV